MTFAFGYISLQPKFNTAMNTYIIIAKDSSNKAIKRFYINAEMLTQKAIDECVMQVQMNYSGYFNLEITQ